MHTEQSITTYKTILKAREIDRLELELVSRGEAFFHVPGTGHEGSVALAPHLIDADWLHCHYRDKALMLARGITPEMFFNSVLCGAASHSHGRQMSAHMSDPERNILSIVGPVGNNALQAVGVASVVKSRPESPIVVCSMGDGTTQQGEVFEAIAEAVRSELPVLFLVHDNRLAISTRTDGKTFYSLPQGPAREFYGLEMHRLNGRDVFACHESFGAIVTEIRTRRGPAIVILDVDRLSSHTNADDERIYRSPEEIQTGWEQGDPLRICQEQLRASGIADKVLDALQAEVADEVKTACEKARRGPEPAPCRTAKGILCANIEYPLSEYRGDNSEPRLTMREAIQKVLCQQLASDEQVVLYGEDIEDPKGDVFGVTRGLSGQFPGRVVNSPLSESTIVGVSIGAALAGARPVAFLQFADFFTLAYNQIASELGSMFWRTAGGWQSPVILMVACGGYKAGLGPFHAQTFESVAAHVPGVDVFVPSTAADAAGLLNAAFQSTRPTIFFYPKSLLNTRTETTSSDVNSQFIPLGKARMIRTGGDITFVGWGNTVVLCERAADELESIGIRSDVLDLRTISPWDKQTILASAEKTGRLVVVHEDNHTCGMGAEVIASIVERTLRPVAVRRVTRPDTYVPCNFENQLEVLPSLRSLLEAAAELLDLDFCWEEPEKDDSDVLMVKAIGSSPADESITITELLVGPGDAVDAGNCIATVEADKASAEITAPVRGTVEEVFLEEGNTVRVGTPLLKIRVAPGAVTRRALPHELPGTPVLCRKTISHSAGELNKDQVQIRRFRVGLGGIGISLGSRVVTSGELAARFAGRDVAGMVKHTGIETRHWINENETALVLAVRAAESALDSEGIDLAEVELIICSTGTPIFATPSMACLVLHELSKARGKHEAQAYDINAACSGYLTALQCSYDYLQCRPQGKVLVVTTEVLSTRLDPNDYATAILFGDAATATVVCGEDHLHRSRALLSRPILSGEGDDGSALSVPHRAGNGEYLRMDGQKVYALAVRRMASMLMRACVEEKLDVNDLHHVVPHQANKRIIDAIQNRAKLPREKVFSNIRHLGNTSSSTIPIALSEILPKTGAAEHIAMCAFGGGFTFGAGILKTL